MAVSMACSTVLSQLNGKSNAKKNSREHDVLLHRPSVSANFYYNMHNNRHTQTHGQTARPIISVLMVLDQGLQDWRAWVVRRFLEVAASGR